LGNVDEELLYAIRAMEVLLQSGVGIAEAMKHVADEDYGDLSVEFGLIFKAVDSGAGLGEAVRKQMQVTSSIGLRRTLSVLAMSIEQDTNVIDRLRSIADKESRSRRIELQAFVESLSAVSEQFLIISVLVPIIVVIMAVIDALVGGSGGAFGGNMPRMPPACTPILFLLAMLAIAGLIVRTRSQEPKI
jgi:flagellar protein FlaJ